MATYKELVYMVLDQIKGVSDDFTFTEDHVIFLLSKYRALLLYQTYKDLKKDIPESNYQTICLNLQRDSTADEVCESLPLLKSVNQIPTLVKIGTPKIYPKNYYLGDNIVYISRDRMQYVGYNKYMTNIIYASIDTDGYLYLKSNNPQYTYLEEVKVTGIFEDIQRIAKLQCDNSNEDEEKVCDILDMKFPIQESLISILIAMVVKDLLGAAYRPEDSSNNAKDDLASITKTSANNTSKE